MQRLLVRTIPRAGDSRVTTHRCAATHRRGTAQHCAWLCTETPPLSSSLPRPSRVSLPPLPSFVTNEVPHSHYDRWATALNKSPIFSWKTYHSQPHEPGFAIGIQDPKSEQEHLALLRRYSEVCEVTKGTEGLGGLVEQTHRVVSNIPDRELSGVISALLAAGREDEVRQLMEAYKQAGIQYTLPWEILLEHYFMKKQLPVALSIVQYLQDAQPSLRSGHYIIAAHAHAQDIPALQLFLRKFETVIPARVEPCEDAIRALMNPRRPDDWPMSDQMWNLVQLGNVDDVITELQKPGMEGINEEYYAVLLQRLAERVDTDAWRKLQLFVQSSRGVQVDDVEFYNGRIKYGNEQRVQEALRDMDAQGVMPNLGTYDGRIYVAGVLGDLKECSKLLEEISDKKLKPTSFTFCTILDYWRAKGKLQNTMQLWDDMCRLQITPSPVAHEKIKEVVFHYATRLDKDELQALYKHVDVSGIPTHLSGLFNALHPENNLIESKRRLASEFRFSSNFKAPIPEVGQAKTPKNFGTYVGGAKSSDSSDSFAKYTYQDGSNLTELANYIESSLQSIPSRTESPILEFIPQEITPTEVEHYDEMRRALRESNKDSAVFLNKAMLVFQDYTKQWFNQILLDVAEDEVEITSEGYSALVHRAWKMGDRKECERLLARIIADSIPETEEIARIRKELVPTASQPINSADALRGLLSELQKPQTELDVQKIQEMAKVIALNLGNGLNLAMPDISHTEPPAPPAPSTYASPSDAQSPASESSHASASSPDSTTSIEYDSPALPSPSNAETTATPPASTTTSSDLSAPLDPSQIASSIYEDIEKSRVERKANQKEEKNRMKQMGTSVAELMERMKETNTMEDRAKVWEFADQQFSEAKIFMFEKMISSCAQEGDLEGSIQLFKDMQNHGIRPTSQIYLIAIEALAGTDGLSDALHHFQEAKKAGLKLAKLKRTTRNALARVAVTRGEMDTLHTIVEEMYEAEMQPDPDVLYMLSINLAEQGDIAGSVRILEEIKTTHSVDPDSLFNALVKTLTTSGNAEHRYKLIEEMAQRGIALNASTLNTLVYELIREGDADASLLLVREIRSMGYDLDLLAEYAFAQYFDAMVSAANRRDDVLKVGAVVDEVGKGKEWVGLPVYGKLILKLLYFGADRRAMKILDASKHFFDTQWHNITVQALAKRKSLRVQTDALVKDMRSAGIPLDATTYASLMRAHLRDGEVQPCIQLMEEAHRNKHDLEEAVYDSLISILVERGQHEVSHKVVQEMATSAVGLTPTALLVLLRQSLMDKDTQGCADVLSEMRDVGSLDSWDINFVVKRHHNFPELIKALEESNEYNLISQLKREQKEAAGEERARTAIEESRKEEVVASPKQVKTTNKEFGPPGLLATFQGLLKLKRNRAQFMHCYDALIIVQPAEVTITQLADLDLLDAKTFHARALECAIVARDMNACAVFLKYAEDHYKSIFIDTMSMLSRMLVSDFSPELFDLACKVAGKNSTMWNLILMATVERGDVDRVGKLVQQIKERKIVIFPRTYSVLLQMFSRMDNLDLCLNLYKHISSVYDKNDGLKSQVIPVLLHTMIRLKRFERWDEIIDDIRSQKVPIDVSQFRMVLQSDKTRLNQLAELTATLPAVEKQKTSNNWHPPSTRRPKTLVSSKSPTPPKKENRRPTTKQYPNKEEPRLSTTHTTNITEKTQKSGATPTGKRTTKVKM